MPQFPDPDPAWSAKLERVYRLCAGLLRGPDAEAGLGGKLLWVGDLDENGCTLMRAANIAGAASLGATADSAALRHANRDGVADFLVNSLDEALRILKNEVRKRQAVSVGVSMGVDAIMSEMRERGVQPDLLPPGDWGGSADLSWFVAHGAGHVEPEPLPAGWNFRAWAPSPPRFDALVAPLLSEDDHLNRRWLRLAPRYLGPAARGVRSLGCTPEMERQLKQVSLGNS